MLLSGEVVGLRITPTTRPCRPHKDQLRFFLNQIQTAQQTIGEFANHAAKLAQQKFELTCERVRTSEGWIAQHGKQALMPGKPPTAGCSARSCSPSKRRLSVKELLQAGYDVGIYGLSFQALVVKQFDKWLKGGIGVGQPQHEHFFQQHLTIGNGIGAALYVRRQLKLAAVNGQRRKVFGERM